MIHYSIIITLLVCFQLCFSQSQKDIRAIDDLIQKQFSWYIGSLDGNSYKKYVLIRTNDKGKLFLDVREYLNELTKQGTASHNFIESEGTRTLGCNHFLNELKADSTFEMDIHKQCDFVYFFFWLSSDRNVTSVKNSSYHIKRKKAIVNTILAGPASSKELTISLIKEQSGWKIDSIAKK
jgi:hypothetical protein